MTDRTSTTPDDHPALPDTPEGAYRLVAELRARAVVEHGEATPHLVTQFARDLADLGDLWSGPIMDPSTTAARRAAYDYLLAQIDRLEDQARRVQRCQTELEWAARPDARDTGLTPRTPWRTPGARWHVHLPVTDDVRDYIAALWPALEPHRDRLSILPLEYLHVTLAWAHYPANTVHGGTRDVLVSELDRLLPELVDQPPDVWVGPVAWNRNGPVLHVNPQATEQLCRTAVRALQGATGSDHFVHGLPDRGPWQPHIALGYVTEPWSPVEVAAVDVALQTLARDLSFPHPMPPLPLRVVAQDTFDADGLTWTDAVYIPATS